MVAETVWDTPERQKYLSETIVEHLYRQGMLSVAEDLCQVGAECLQHVSCKHSLNTINLRKTTRLQMYFNP